MTPADAVAETSDPALQALAELDVLERPADQAAVAVQTFFGTASVPVWPEWIEPVSRAIADADASALYRLGYSYAPFHCPDCTLTYCGAHWNWRTFEDDPYTGIEGDCPRGHFHVLAY
ncbi:MULTISPECIES: hypothetical protein [Mycobacterium]|uniref:hypothetical protein n=1 Tax=Mycobacterium TaxID=1763 RepID=UPI0012E3A193|nr:MULTISPECIES: hypothetical protein [Mycobacterium]MDP7728030.1 hypothetical protein [Mycobacterium sp. TY813]